MSTHEIEILHKMRDRARQRREHPPRPSAPLTLGERCADLVADAVGSWRFIIAQSVVLIAWLIWNIASGARFDPYPFILLNLALSFQAAYSAPIIMMSQNRQSDIDRRRAIQDFEVNQKAELEIETLHQKIDLLREQEIARLTEAVAKLADLLEKRA
ncbi:MAG TPA: DUF1003 domain-containing protein [Caulobacterales bacterium]|nr:DUF1003 domain-containing protein [Caulobacterales bacterium]